MSTTATEIDTKNEILKEEVAEEEEEDVEVLKQKTVKLQRRGTVSLADLIPLATATHKAKHRTSVLYNHENANSPLARALTKVKIGLQTHKLKEKYLTSEWIRLALAVPLDESTINMHLIKKDNTIDYKKNNRTKEIVNWYEHKYKRSVLPLNELETRVDTLRQQKLIFTQQHQELLLQQQKELQEYYLIR